MPDQYSSEKKTIGELLSMTSPPIRVPEWQRNYSWTSTEVETFWLDLLSFSDRYPGNAIRVQEYFLGAVVLVEQDGKHLLLDGQQRLATATILLSVIRDFLSRYSSDAANTTQQSYIAAYDYATDEHTYKLSLNRYDKVFFRREVQESPTPETLEAHPTLASHKLIRKARQFFEGRFREKYDEFGGGRPAFGWALWISRILTNHVSVVVVKSADEENAAAVFETLNDRGIGLSTPDLLRNLLLRQAAEDDQEEIIDCWADVLEVADYAKVEDFLRHYWLSRQGDVKTRRLYREIKSRLEQEHIDSLEFSRDLARSASLYRDIVTATHENRDIREALAGVSMLGAKALLPAILSSYDTGTDADRQRFIHCLIAFYVRHNIIGKLETSRLETVAYRIAKQLRENGDYNASIQALQEAATTDERFAQEFRTASISRQQSARYLLREIEHAKRETGEMEVGPPETVHLEHIYSRKPETGRWPDHTEVVDRLGNLTLLSSRINREVRNAEFAVKKEHYARSDILLTRELTEYDVWDTSTIDQRQEALARIALGIWTFPE